MSKLLAAVWLYVQVWEHPDLIHMLLSLNPMELLGLEVLVVAVITLVMARFRK